MIKRFLDGPWQRVVAVWWVFSTALLAGGGWVCWIRLDGPQWRAGDWRDLAIFWAVVSAFALPWLARAGRRASR